MQGALVGGDVRYGGLIDLCSISLADQREGVVTLAERRFFSYCMVILTPEGPKARGSVANLTCSRARYSLLVPYAANAENGSAGV